MSESFTPTFSLKQNIEAAFYSIYLQEKGEKAEEKKAIKEEQGRVRGTTIRQIAS